MRHSLFFLLCFSLVTTKNIFACGHEKNDYNKELTFSLVSKIHQSIKTLSEPYIHEGEYPLTFKKNSVLGEKSFFKIITFYDHDGSEEFFIYISEKSLPKFTKLYQQEKLSRFDTKDFTYISTEPIKMDNNSLVKKFLIFTLDPNNKTVMFVDGQLALQSYKSKVSFYPYPPTYSKLSLERKKKHKNLKED